MHSEEVLQSVQDVRIVINEENRGQRLGLRASVYDSVGGHSSLNQRNWSAAFRASPASYGGFSSPSQPRRWDFQPYGWLTGARTGTHGPRTGRGRLESDPSLP